MVGLNDEFGRAGPVILCNHGSLGRVDIYSWLCMQKSSNGWLRAILGLQRICLKILIDLESLSTMATLVDTRGYLSRESKSRLHLYSERFLDPSMSSTCRTTTVSLDEMSMA